MEQESSKLMMRVQKKQTQHAPKKATSHNAQSKPPTPLRKNTTSLFTIKPPYRPTTMKTTSLLLLASLATTTSAFGSFGKPKTATPKLPLPTFDDATQRYVKSPDDDGVMPYDAIGAALRHGPVPFFTRLTNADEYEQGVLKYMGTAKVSRAEAVGNVDAKLNNPMDWAYQKMEEKNGKPKIDYTRLDPKQAALTSIWAFGITPLAINVIASTVGQFNSEPGPCISKAFEGLGICSEYIPK